MWNELLVLARGFRRRFYEMSSSRIYGVDVDIILHVTVGALIFALVARRWGNRTACWTLGICIVAKEIIDLFAKSHLEYIHLPSESGSMDTIKDILFGILGGLFAWAWRTHYASRK